MMLMRNAHKVKPQVSSQLPLNECSLKYILYLREKQLLASAIASWGYFLVGCARGWGSPGIPSLNRTVQESLADSSNYFELSQSDLIEICKYHRSCL